MITMMIEFFFFLTIAWPPHSFQQDMHLYKGSFFFFSSDCFLGSSLLVLLSCQAKGNCFQIPVILYFRPHIEMSERE